MFNILHLINISFLCFFLMMNLLLLQKLIKNNYNGVLFKPGDEHDLAAKLKLMLCLSKKEKKKIINRAKLLVNEKYNIEKMCNLNLELYNSIIQ